MQMASGKEADRLWRLCRITVVGRVELPAVEVEKLKRD